MTTKRYPCGIEVNGRHMPIPDICPFHEGECRTPLSIDAAQELIDFARAAAAYAAERAERRSNPNWYKWVGDESARLVEALRTERTAAGTAADVEQRRLQDEADEARATAAAWQKAVICRYPVTWCFDPLQPDVMVGNIGMAARGEALDEIRRAYHLPTGRDRAASAGDIIGDLDRRMKRLTEQRDELRRTLERALARVNGYSDNDHRIGEEVIMPVLEKARAW